MHASLVASRLDLLETGSGHWQPWRPPTISRLSVGTCLVVLVCLRVPAHHVLRLLRFRPPNSLELREGSDIVVAFDDNLKTVQLKSAAASTGPEKDGFTFDRVFPMNTKQHEVFDYGVKRWVAYHLILRNES